MAAHVVTWRVAPPVQRARGVHPRRLGAQRPAKLGVEPATKELRSTAGLLLILPGLLCCGAPSGATQGQ